MIKYVLLWFAFLLLAGTGILYNQHYAAQYPAGPLYTCPGGGQQIFYTRDCAEARGYTRAH
jgi:hypothetical protein